MLLSVVAALASPNAHSSRLVVPDDVATIQTALSSTADTVLVRAGDYPEALSLTRPLVLLAFEPAAVPTTGSMTIDADQGGSNWPSEAIIREIGFNGPVQIVSQQHSLQLGLEQCRMQSGLVQNGDPAVGGALRVVECTVIGDVSLANDAISFANNRVNGGGVSLRSATLLNAHGNQITGATGPGLFVHNTVTPASVLYNRITNCGIGIVSNTGGIIQFNEVSECTEDGFRDLSPGDGLTPGRGLALLVDQNRFERCGRNGIHVASTGPTTIERNIVGYSGLHGIASRGLIQSNTVFQNQGNGITTQPNFTHHGEVLPVASVVRNISAYNFGYGLFGDGSTGCNDWFANSLGAVGGGSASVADLQLDPLFCDLAAGDVTLHAASPLVSAPECGLIGAAVVACGQGSENPRLGKLSVRVRARADMALLSLANDSPAELELIDVTGRRVWATDISAPAPGARDVALGVQPPKGLYFLRVTQGERRAASKAILAR